MTPDELIAVVASLADGDGGTGAGGPDGITGTAVADDDTGRRSAQIAAALRSQTGHRWVGVYRVTGTEVRILGYSGPGEPAYPTFPPTSGLTGTAVATGRSVVVDDVTADPRYLTVFGTTRSELVVPVLHPRTGAVLGTLDLESEHLAAFGAAERELLERCAAAITPLYGVDR
ncbi:GAF domain-containing protein [Plantactinospora sp. KLBMP9567]|uniref:GAF domain-containing protein n=1 Tax=Plantactinospora sp. KLBMP9567 TaxID=3085900 RepID=UPI0029822FC7|nr:GAF domain-containing protein [Plantactinospora sp. KLBMP9567]MDW5322856.1 GAF domain-containing protein [Plantactinospora sp. KLBMP9567]